MQILDIIKALGNEVISASGDLRWVPAGVTNDHRKVTPGGLFVCVKGFVADGHDFASGALINGASALISQIPVEALGVPPGHVGGIRAFVRVKDARRALAAASQLFYGEPTKKFDLTGVTGTKGKTTTVYMIRAVLQAAGLRPGMIGTVENDIAGEIIPAKETTPDSPELAGYFYKMAEHGCGNAVIEVSSQALALSRVDFCDFDTGVFTNFYRDHISPHEHADAGEYLAAKLKLFSICKKAVVNADIKEFGIIRDACAGNDCGLPLAFSADETSANHGVAEVRACRIELMRERGGRAVARFYAETPWYSGEFSIGLPGRYNISNALAAMSVCGLSGMPIEAVREGLLHVNVRGRTQFVDEGQGFTVLIDYAHNAASLEALLAMLREYEYKSITTVFGCGGNRARERRYEMGRVSGRMSDFTVVTSDNPRLEDPGQISADIESGLKKTGGAYAVIQDRREAINYAIKNAGDGGLVLIAGKGHETTQTMADRIIPFDDALTASEILRGGA